MLGVIVFFVLQVFFFGFTKAECERTCNPCKEISAPADPKYIGNWSLVNPTSSRCDWNISCLYRRDDDEAEMCFCDPGPIDYEECEQADGCISNPCETFDDCNIDGVGTCTGCYELPNGQKQCERRLEDVTVMWMGSEPPFTTVTLPDFAPASPKCSIPWIPAGIPSSSEKYGVHYLFHRGYTAHAQVINGILYECDHYSCKSYDGEKWKLVVIDGKGIKLGTSLWSQPREQAASVFIPGPQPKWIVHGGEAFRDALIWTPGSEAGTGTWESYPDFVSPGPMEGVDLHCIVIIDGKVLQVGGRPWRKDVWGKWYGRAYTNKVFLGDVEVASLKEPRIYHTCAFFNNRTYVAGGGGGNYASVPIYGSVEIYDHTTDTWINGPTLPFEIDDGVPKLKVIQGQLYYIGGNEVGKVFRLGDETWKDIADIPKGQKWIATIVEKTC